MKIKMLRSVYGNGTNMRKGDTVEVSDSRAKSLIDRHLAEAVGGAYKAAPQKKGAAGKGAVRPSKARPAGGQTGAAKPPSSSPEDPRRAKRRLRKQKASSAS